jgi:hypothetical protein
MQTVAPHKLFALIGVLLLVGMPGVSLAADLSPGEIVLKHLDSIGSAQARSSVKSRVVQAGATYRVLVGGTGAIDGKSVIATAGQKSNFLFKINAGGFRGEQFICDGNKLSVAGTYADKTRSEFGNFILSEDVLLRENLLGGVWSVDWPLLDVEARKAKLHSEGTKKLDGKEFLVLLYQPKKTNDLEIYLYFDPQTFQHVASVYKLQPSNTMIGGETAMARRQSRRSQVEERFSDFKSADGLTLPTHYDLRFTLETENGFSKSIEWEVKAVSIGNNVPIDDRSFEVK